MRKIKELADSFSAHIREGDKYAILRGAMLLIVFVTLTTGAVLTNNYKQSRLAAINTLIESTSQSKAKLVTSVSLGADRLRGLANILSGYGVIGDQRTSAVLGSNLHDSLFSHIALRLPNGNSLQADGTVYNSIQWCVEYPAVESEDPDTDGVFVGRRATSAVNGRDIFRVFTPVVIDGEKKADIYGVVETTSLSSSFVSTGFSGKSALLVFESGTGNVIMDTENWLKVKGSAIGSLSKLNFCNGFSSRSFFDDISNGKSGYSMITTENGDMVCAYAPVGVSDWFIMQLVPSAVLFSDLEKNSSTMLFEIIITLVGLMLFIFWIYSRVEKVKLEDINSAYQMKMRDRILASALSETSMRVFLYYRDTGEITILKNGSGIKHSGERIKNGIEYIIKYEVLDCDDARRMKNSFALTGSGNSVKFTVCSKRSGAEQWLRYTLTSVKNERGRQNIIICTARDVTESEIKKQEMLDVERFRNSVVTYKTTGLELFLERNRWKLVWNNEPIFSGGVLDGEYRDYDDDLSRTILPVIHDSDRMKFSNVMNRLNLLEAFRRGTTELSLEYRILSGNTPESDYEYRVLEIHLLRDKHTDEAKANIYIRNVEKSDFEKFTLPNNVSERQYIISSVLSTVTKNCTWIGFAELTQGRIAPISSDGHSFESSFDFCDFEDHMNSFIETKVYPEDRSICHTMNSIKYLGEHLSDSNDVITHYRKAFPKAPSVYINVRSRAHLISCDNGKFEVVFVEETES